MKKLWWVCALVMLLQGVPLWATGELCSNPIIVDIEPNTPVVINSTTCGMGDDYRHTCLSELDSSYDHGEDVIYYITLQMPSHYLIDLRSNTPGAQIGWSITPACPATGSCFEKAAVHADSAVRAIATYRFDETYYLFIDNCAGCGNPPAPACFDYTLTITPIPGQGETCWHPWILTSQSLPFSFAGSTSTFSQSNDLDWPCPNPSTSRDVVWEYTPPTDMTVNFSLAQSSYDTKFYVLEGNPVWFGCYGPPIACNDDDLTGHCPDPTRSYLPCVTLLAGHYYYFVVDGSNGENGDYRVDVTAAGCQSGEVCAVAIPITEPLPVSLTGSTCGYQNDLDAACPDPSSSPDVVYSYVPPADQNVTFMLCESAYNTKLSVYDDCFGGPLYCNDDAGLNCQGDPSRSFLGCLPLLGGHRYYIVIDGANGECGDYWLRAMVCYPTRPCESCTPPNEMLGDVTTSVCGDSILGNLSWQGKWVGQFTGLAGATYHWDLCPFEPCGGHADNGPDPVDVDLLIMDSNCQLVDGVDGEEACNWRPNDWQWICPANGIYYAWIAPWPALDNETRICNGVAEQSFTLVYYRSEAPVIPGESCADAPLLSGSLPLIERGNTCNYSNTYDVNCVQGTDPNSRDAVYKYIPAEDQWLTLGICEAEFDPKLYVFADSCSGDPYVCNDRDNGVCENASRPFLGCVPVTAGRTYYIVVDGVNEWECGEYTLTLNACSPVPGDVIETAFPVPALPFTATGTTTGFFDQYSPECNGGRSSAPDVVYRYAPVMDETVEIDLCNSCLENRVYIYENSLLNLIACDDAGCWPGSRAYIPNITFLAGNIYYIVVDGDYEQRGTYQLDILPWAGGRCCHHDGTCQDNVSARQCSYHLGRGNWTANTDCANPCPAPVTPPAALRSIPAPVVNGCGYGLTVAATCTGELYYTNACSDSLYKINTLGQLVRAIQVTDQGNPTGVNLCCWDPSRQLLWASTWENVGTIDPISGSITWRFRTLDVGEVLAYDPTDGTFWQAHWGCSSLSHLDSLGNVLGTLELRDTNGLFDAYVHGLSVGANNSIYVSHWDARITRHDKSTGAYLNLVAQQPDSASRAIACDAATFSPQTVLWWKFDNSFSAYAIENGACTCQCPRADSVTVSLNAARTHMQVNFHAAAADSFRIMSSTSKTSIYPAGFTAEAAILAVPGINSWTDPAGFADYKRYVVIHICR